jgi:hypothetical protein
MCDIRVMRGRLLSAVALLALCAAPAGAQTGPSRVDETTLALYWISGRFAMPVTCDRADGSTVDVEEAVTIRPAPERGESTFKATFFGIDVADARRCYNLVLSDLPDRRGVIYLTFRSFGRPDLGTRDFRLRLEDGVLDYPVQDGKLHVRPIGGEEDAARVVDFGGGKGALRVHLLSPTSDGWRLLSRFRGEPVAREDPRRRLQFELSEEGEPALRGYYLETARR